FSSTHYVSHRDLHSFPTRRSSDLRAVVTSRVPRPISVAVGAVAPLPVGAPAGRIVWYMRSANSARPFLKPLVETFAMLLAVTSRSEEHTSELQSLAYLVCRLLLEK